MKISKEKTALPEDDKEIPEVSSVRWRTEDRALIQRISKKTGIASTTEILRVALRELAKKEKV